MLVTSSRTDIFFPELDKVAALVPNGRKVAVGGESADELDEAIAVFRKFLDSSASA